MPAGAPTYDQVFFCALFVVAAYLASMYMLAFRLGWLRRTGRAPDAPSTIGFFFDWFGVGFLLRGRHKGVGDPLTSGLVIAGRVLLIVYLPLFAFLTWKFWTLS